jgi:predicted Zn-dependent protease
MTMKKVAVCLFGLFLITVCMANYVLAKGTAEEAKALVGEIAAGSQEQAQTIDHINQAINDMDRVVQENAAQAEQTASFSEEMNGQAEQMGSLVMELTLLVRGANGQVKGRKGSIEDQATELLPGPVEYEMPKSSGKRMDG